MHTPHINSNEMVKWSNTFTYKIQSEIEKLNETIENYIQSSTKDIETELSNIRDIVDESIKRNLPNELKDRSIPVIKYIHPKYLESLKSQGRLNISNAEGFTWGDGVYVTPLYSAASSIMYGRCGILGWYKIPKEFRMFDATKQKGLELYQQWIQKKKHLYKQLTTTIHASYANRMLRNEFKKQFNINLIIFRPDEVHKSYVSDNDVWYAITDNTLPRGMNGYSNAISECKWIILVGEEFIRSDLGFKSFIEYYVKPSSKRPISFNEYRIFKSRDYKREFPKECLNAYISDEIVVVLP